MTSNDAELVKAILNNTIIREEMLYNIFIRASEEVMITLDANNDEQALKMAFAQDETKEYKNRQYTIDWMTRPGLPGRFENLPAILEEILKANTLFNEVKVRNIPGEPGFAVMVGKKVWHLSGQMAGELLRNYRQGRHHMPIGELEMWDISQKVNNRNAVKEGGRES